MIVIVSNINSNDFFAHSAHPCVVIVIVIVSNINSNDLFARSAHPCVVIVIVIVSNIDSNDLFALTAHPCVSLGIRWQWSSFFPSGCVIACKRKSTRHCDRLPVLQLEE